jgi:hypothetical protein
MCVCVGRDFLILTLAGIRQMIVAAIPSHLFAAVAAGIGLFIGLIGLKNGGLVVNSPPRVWRWAICMKGADAGAGRPCAGGGSACVAGECRDPDRDCGHHGSGLGGRRGVLT